MMEHPLLMSGWSIQRYMASAKTVTRRVVTRCNSILNGHARPTVHEWERLSLYDPRVFVDPGPSPAGNPGPYLHVPYDLDGDEAFYRLYPWVFPGDTLVFREAYRLCGGVPSFGSQQRVESAWVYRADSPDGRTCPNCGKVVDRWKPSIHMPRAAARFTPPVISVRVERVRDIGHHPEDLIAEGFELGERCCNGFECGCQGTAEFAKPLMDFMAAWDEMHAKPKPRYARVDGKRVTTHYESYPWAGDGPPVREHRGKPWYVFENPWVLAIEFEGHDG